MLLRLPLFLSFARRRRFRLVIPTNLWQRSVQIRVHRYSKGSLPFFGFAAGPIVDDEGNVDGRLLGYRNRLHGDRTRHDRWSLIEQRDHSLRLFAVLVEGKARDRYGYRWDIRAEFRGGHNGRRQRFDRSVILRLRGYRSGEGRLLLFHQTDYSRGFFPLLRG